MKIRKSKGREADCCLSPILKGLPFLMNVSAPVLWSPGQGNSTPSPITFNLKNALLFHLPSVLRESRMSRFTVLVPSTITYKKYHLFCILDKIHHHSGADSMAEGRGWQMENWLCWSINSKGTKSFPSLWHRAFRTFYLQCSSIYKRIFKT